MTQQPHQLPSSLLPDLERGPGPAQVGVWKEENRLAFESLAENLLSIGELPRTISSIPDMWARPLLVDSALRDDRHPLHQEIKKQWRGMLAAIALKVTKDFDLQVCPVSLRDSGNNPNDNAFLTPLRNLISDPYGERTFYRLSGGQRPWETLYVFVWRNKAVGMISPSSLICPAEGGDWTGLSWYQENGGLQSPLDSDDLSNDDKNQLYRWLDNLCEELRNEATDTAGRIGELIRNFQRDIGEPTPRSERFRPHETGNPFEHPINLGGVRSFNRLIAQRPRGIDGSSLKLRTANGRQVIFFPSTNPDELRTKLETQWPDRMPTEIMVYSTTLDSYNSEEQLQRDLRELGDTSSLKEADLFLEDVSLVKDDLLSRSRTLLPRRSREITYTIRGTYFDEGEVTNLIPLLPVSPRLFEYFSARELNQMIRFEQRGSEFLAVSIELSLGSELSPGGGRTYTAYKQYRIEETNVLTSLPLLEVFPNFGVEGERSQEWQDYYVLCYDHEGEKALKLNLPKTKAPPHNAPLDRQRTNKSTIFHLSQFPSFITFERDQKPLGITLLEDPTTINRDSNKTWVVGVDFGTSFTNVFYRQKDSNQGSRELTLSSLIFQVTNSFSPLERSRILYDSFMPCEEQRFPLSTILTVRGADGQEKPVPHGRVYMLLSQSQQLNREDLRGDLKWRVDNLHTNLFLRHLALLISAEAAYNRVSQIEWAISYPTSFSIDDESTYLGNWRSIIQSLNGKNGISHQWKENGGSRTECFRTEALLMAQYLADVKYKDLMYTTCIDMGGGSSDISIWRTNRLVHQCSVRLAGHELFSNFLLHQSRKDEDFIPMLLDLKGECPQLDDLSILDSLLISKQEDWLAAHIPEKIAKLGNLRDVIQLSTLGIAGLYYYVGTILKGLSLGNCGYTTHDVFIGGHGSRIFHWLSGSGRFDDQTLAHTLFSKMLSEGSGFDDVQGRTMVSDNPKAEIAHALTLSFDSDTTRLSGLDNGEAGYVFTGEKCRVNGEEFLETSHLRLQGIIEEFETEELSNLKRFFNSYHFFLQYLKPRAGRVLDIDLLGYRDKIRNKQGFWSDVKRKVDAGCKKMTGNAKNANEIRIEPPFIIGLKALLKVLSQ